MEHELPVIEMNNQVTRVTYK